MTHKSTAVMDIPIGKMRRTSICSARYRCNMAGVSQKVNNSTPANSNYSEDIIYLGIDIPCLSADNYEGLFGN